MEGEDEDTGDSRSYFIQPAWKKIIILLAGSAMNFLLGLLVCVFLMLQVNVFVEPVLADFMDGFPLEGESGLMVGDEILSIDGETVYLSDSISLLLGRSGETVDIEVRRDGEKILVEDLPLKLKEYEYEGEKVWRYGLIFEKKETTLADKVGLGLRQSLQFVQLVGLSLEDLLNGKVGMGEVSGVIGIVDVMSSAGAASQTFALGLLNVLYFAAFVAVNLAVMNLLPIPMLDGGKIFFLLVNLVFTGITKKQIDPKYEGYIHTIGFVLLLVLMVVIAVNDIWKLFA
jgi:regulator of sigma E protease